MLEIGFVVGLSETFPEEGSPNLSAYLTGIPREQVLLVGSANLAYQTKKFKNVKDLLEYWFRPTNADFANEAYKRLRPIEVRHQPLVIAGIPPALKLYTYALNNLGPAQSQTDEQVEINLFKSFLLQNDLINETEKVINKTTEHLPFELRWYAMQFANSIRFSDVINYDLFELFVIELIRAVFLFEFLTDSDKTQTLIQEFNKFFETKSWNEYLKRLTGISLSILKKTNEGYLELSIAEDDNFNKDISFLDKLALVPFDELTDNDFKAVRERPIHKVSNKKYRIISDLFCVERIFKGLYFNLKSINEKLPKESKLKDLRGLYTYNFSEKHLLYIILSKSFPKKYLRIKGADILESGYQGGPDFYVRKKNRAFVFESKDSLINAVIKETGNFTDLYADLASKFYKDDKSPKAVMQLINTIVSIYQGKFRQIDADYNIDFLRIYPILVIHDRQLDVTGFNKILNYWFKAELAILSGIPRNRVMPITVIDMGTLILIHELIIDRKIRLEDVIDDYHEFTRLRKAREFRFYSQLERHAFDTGIPFSFFVKQVIKKTGLKRYPYKLLMEKAMIGLSELDKF